MVAAATPQSCDACHKPGLGTMMIPLWQKTTKSLFDEVAEDIRAAEAAGMGAEVLDETRRLLDLIQADGSWGVHNPKYTQQLLERARDRLVAAQAPKPTEGSP